MRSTQTADFALHLLLCSREHTHTHRGRHHTADNTRTADRGRVTDITHAQRAIVSGGSMPLDSGFLSHTVFG